MSSLNPTLTVKEQKITAFQFEEYQRPPKVSKKLLKTEEGEHDDHGSEKAREDLSENSSLKAPAQRSARVWKVVDSRKILSKRKYVRKGLKDKHGEQDHSSLETSSATAEDHHKQFCNAQTRSILLGPEQGGMRGVPFECLPHQNDPSVQGALDFLIHDIGAVAMPGSRHASGFSPKVHAFIHLGFAYPTFFHAVLAFAQGYKEVATTGATQPSQIVLYHRGMATQGLYARLKDPATCADDISILITFFLVDNVWRYGENEIGRQHYAGLLKMVEMRGGLAQLGISGILKAMIDFAEVTDVGDSLRSPITAALPDLRYYSPPCPAHVGGMISRLPRGYAEMALRGQLSIETISTIASLEDWLRTDPNIRSLAPHKQIGSARRCLAASKPPRGGDLEEAVCLGIIITSMRAFHARFSRMDHSLLDRIVELSREVNNGSRYHAVGSSTEREHIAFLIIVAVEASEKCIELQSHVRALVDLLIRHELFARSWDGMERVLRKFFWVPFAVDDWRMCWLRHLKYRAEAEAAVAARALGHAESEVVWKNLIDLSPI